MKEAHKRFDRQLKCPYCSKHDYRQHGVFELICNHCQKHFGNKKVDF